MRYFHVYMLSTFRAYTLQQHICVSSAYNLVGIFLPVNNDNNTLVFMWIGVADYKHKPNYINDVSMYWTAIFYKCLSVVVVVVYSHDLYNLVGIFWLVNNNNNTLVLMWIRVADYKHKPNYINDVFMYWTWLSIFAIT